ASSSARTSAPSADPARGAREECPAVPAGGFGGSGLAPPIVSVPRKRNADQWRRAARSSASSSARTSAPSADPARGAREECPAVPAGGFGGSGLAPPIVSVPRKRNADQR